MSWQSLLENHDGNVATTFALCHFYFSKVFHNMPQKGQVEKNAAQGRLIVRLSGHHIFNPSL